MSTLRSALADVLRGLGDAELARIVRAAPDDVLRPLVQIGLNLDADEEEEAEAEEAAPPRRTPRAKPKAARVEEDVRGSRPRKGRGVERLLEALSDGPKSTSELAELLGISKSGVRQAAARAGKSVRMSRPNGGKADAIFEASRK